MPWRLRLPLAEAEPSIPPWRGAEPAPCCLHHRQHHTLLLTLPYPCYIRVLNTLQMLLDAFLTHFLWSPCNLLPRNNCNLFKCQQATCGRWQLCARAEQLQGTGPILPLEQRSELEERKRPFTSINHSPPCSHGPWCLCSALGLALSAGAGVSNQLLLLLVLRTSVCSAQGDLVLI